MTTSVEAYLPYAGGTPLPGGLELPDLQKGFGHIVARAAIGVGGAAVAGFLFDEHAGHRLKWNRAKPVITEYEADAGVSPSSAILVTAGFNSRPEATAMPLCEVFSQFGRVAMLHDSHAGLSIKDNFETVASWAEHTGTRQLTLYGPSMGTLINIAMAPQLKLEAGLDIRILMDGSPYDFDDLKGSARRNMIKVLAGMRFREGGMGVRGGPGTRLLLETLGYGIDNAGEDKGRLAAIKHAVNKLTSGDMQSNGQCIDRARLLRYGDIQQYLAFLQGSVPFVYMGPDDPERDKVVDQVTSLAKYRRNLRQGVTHVTHPGIGHANPGTFPFRYRKLTYRAMRQLETAAA